MANLLPFARGPGRGPLNARTNRGPGPDAPAGSAQSRRAGLLRRDLPGMETRPPGAPGTDAPMGDGTGGTDVLPAPELLSPADGGSAAQGAVSLAWRAVPGAMQYYLSVCASPDMRAPCMVFDEPVAAVQNGNIVSVAMEFHDAGPFFWSVSAARSSADGAPRSPRSAVQRLMVTTPAPTEPPATTPAPTTPAPTTPVPSETGTPSPSASASPSPSQAARGGISGRGKAVIVLGVLAALGLGGKAVYDYGKDKTRADG